MPDRAGLTQNTPDHARVFFALWPDERVRSELDRVAARLHKLRGGRRTRAETIHLTLVFIGEVPRAELPRLQEGAADIAVPVFEIVFDQAECWRHNRIAFVTTSRPPPELMGLVTALEAVLERIPIAFDRRPYKPHVTLVRNADCRPEGPPLQPILWTAREFVLVESRLCPEGAQYPQLGRYPLVG